MKFLSISIALTIATVANTLDIRKHTEKQAHGWQLTTVSESCCTSKGGTLCGNVVRDCCKKGCQKGYLDTEWCIDDEIFNPTDCNTCTHVCKNKGGMICATNLLTGANIECCTMGNCVGSLDRSCKANQTVDLGNCERDSVL